MNNPEKIKEWTQKIADFNKSGKSKQNWCEENNITSQNFGYWYNRLSAPNQKTKWLPLKIEEDEVDKPDNIIEEQVLSITPINVKVGIVSIEVHPGFNKELLVDILTTLKAL